VDFEKFCLDTPLTEINNVVDDGPMFLTPKELLITYLKAQAPSVRFLVFFCCKLASTRTLLLQRDRVTRLSAQIMELQNIPFENGCNRQMTLKVIKIAVFYVGRISHPVSGLLLQCLYLAPFTF